MTVEARIHETIDRLTAAEKRAARGLLANYPTIGLAPVAEFAQASGASPATVLRFVARIGFRSYPEFQRALRDELEERNKSPLQRSHTAPRHDNTEFLGAFMQPVADNMAATASRIPASEFEAACARLADTRHACHLAGGRFTDAMALYVEAHLRRARPGVRRLEGRAAGRQDQLLDIRAGDTAVLFDVRRYDSDLLETARLLASRRAFTVLVTDEWISPISRFAKIVLPCHIGIGRTWDSNTPVFALSEALIARTTELAWASAAKRIEASD
jgi:DNA-binding MurR/RpiR family transcriptional regulator